MTSESTGFVSRTQKIDKGLSRHQRISDSRVFREAFAGDTRYVGKLIVMWLRNGPGASLRLGVIASKRTFRRSVDRSKAKRKLREAFRLNRHRFSGDIDVVLVARRRIINSPSRAVERELVKLAVEAGLCSK